MRFAALRSAAALGLAIPFISSTPGLCAQTGLGPQPETSSALFVGVLAALKDSSASILQTLISDSDAKVTIDPRPLRAREVGGVANIESTVSIAGSPDVDSLSRDERTRRIRAIETAGFTQGDVTVFRRCPGPLVPPSSQPLPADPWKDCPPSRTVVAVFGPLSLSDTVSRVEVLVLAAAPVRRALINTLAMKVQNGQWHLVKQDAWAIVE